MNNRELDADVARLVMGWRREGEAWYAPSGNSAELCMIPRYSTDIATAMEVVENLIARDQTVQITKFGVRGPWEIYVGNSRGCVREKSSSLPEVICRAALAALPKG